jgi:hypothetical protein
MHLQIHAYRKEADSRKQNLIFHALWVLYVLTAVTIANDTAAFVVNLFVSDNEHLSFLNVVLIIFARTAISIRRITFRLVSL